MITPVRALRRRLGRAKNELGEAIESLQRTRDKRRLRRAVQKHGFWFVDIPRTSSSSIRSELGKRFGPAYAKTNVLESAFSAKQLGSDHATASMMRDEWGAELWERLFVFTVVRNPWERMLSMYNYRRRVNAIPTEWSLSDYLTRLRDAPDSRPFRPHMFRYGASDFILDSEGTLLVDCIVRFEDRDRGLREVAERIGMPALGSLHLQRVGHSATDYRAHYDRTSRAIIAELYARDIEMFGYEF